jgi:F0F1-type ATP synthase membrane subunit b/b'
MPEFNATLVFVMISFVIFMILMRAIYFEPILKLKYERERKLADDQTSARQFAEDFERIQAEYLAGLQQARKEAHAVIQEVRQQAKTSAQQALTEARANAQVETDRQMTELQNWRERTYQQLASERDALTQAIISKVTSGHKVRTASGG